MEISLELKGAVNTDEFTVIIKKNPINETAMSVLL